jgi:NADH dehydrogenase
MIPTTNAKRVVIIGGGFGGVELVRRLKNSPYQVVLIDRFNYHQFQPLYYQVATSGLEPTSIVFPFRRNFQRMRNFHFRLANVSGVDRKAKQVHTDIGPIDYDYLVIATGAGNNFFGMEEIEQAAYPMKSLNESLRLRNTILETFEQALSVSEEERNAFLTFVIAGGGPTGVELAGTLAEMRRFVLPKDYPELNFSKMRIVLVEGSDRVLSAMSEASSAKAKKYLERLGVEVQNGIHVKGYKDHVVALDNGQNIPARMLIWAAGIKGNVPAGMESDQLERGQRLKVNAWNQLTYDEAVFAIGDVASMDGDPAYPHGHPQLAQAAIQQGRHLAANLKRMHRGEKLVGFRYKNLGTMATVGRNKAVVELPRYAFAGFFAWAIWMLVHLRSILGVKNKFLVFLDWVWNYFTYNLSLRLIIKRKDQ